MKVVIRCDASSRIGMGHLTRCLTLADALAPRGVSTRFVSRESAGHFIEGTRQRGFEVDTLAAPAADGAEAMERDAEETIAALRGARPDWLIVDHYGLDESWEKTLRPCVRRLMVIDDLTHRRHDCDLLLDQNETGRTASDYRERLPSGSRLALGPRHALLHPEYARRRAMPARPRQPVRRVLVFFGGTDPYDMTGLALAALSAAEFAGLDVEIVVGANYAHRSALEIAAAARPHTRVLGQQPQLAQLLDGADLAIGAGGTTTWERLCLGVPSVVISIADNQRAGCEALARRGLIRYCGAVEQVQGADIAAAVQECLQRPEVLEAMAADGRALVDGLGSARIAEFIAPVAAAALGLRPALAADSDLFFDWVNEAEVRRQSLDSRPIAREQHRAWFAAKLNSVNSRLFVLLAGQLPVGQIRFDLNDGVARIDYSIDALFRGRGWAKTLIAQGMRQLGETREFRAEVKTSNPASAAVFRRLGFEESATPSADGLRVFTMGVS